MSNPAGRIIANNAVMGANVAAHRVLVRAREGMRRAMILNCLLLIVLASCTGPKPSLVVDSLPQGISIAIAPSGGVLVHAVGIELFNRGWRILDPEQMSKLMLRYNMTETELSKPEHLTILKNKGSDGILFVRSTVGLDGKLQSVTVRIKSIYPCGRIIAGFFWEYGWGGQACSVSGWRMRKDIAGAAKEIVNALIGKK